MSGHGSSQGLAEAEDGLRVHASRVYKILKGCISVAVKSGLTWLAFTSAIATVFQGEYICRRVSEEFIDGRTIGNIAGITVEGQKCVFGFVVRNPPSVQLYAVGRSQPNILDRQSARTPIAREPTWIAWEKYQTGFEYPDKCQHRDIANEN